LINSTLFTDTGRMADFQNVLPKLHGKTPRHEGTKRS
jgi:hypothetical protein